MNYKKKTLLGIGVRSILASMFYFAVGCSSEKTETPQEVKSAPPPAPLADGIWVFGEEPAPDVKLQLQIVDAYNGQMKLKASASTELSLQLPATTRFEAIDRNNDRDREVCLAETVTLELTPETQEFTLPYFFPSDRSLAGYHKKPGGYRYEFQGVDYRLAKVFRRPHPKAKQLKNFLQLAKRDQLSWIDMQTGTLMIKSDISLGAYRNAVQYAFRDHMLGKSRKTVNYAGVMRVAKLLEEIGLAPSDYALYRDLLEHVERNPYLREN